MIDLDIEIPEPDPRVSEELERLITNINNSYRRTFLDRAEEHGEPYDSRIEDR